MIEAVEVFDAVVLCAGRGSRLMDRTDHMPKCLVEVGGQPILGRMMRSLHAAGAGKIVIVVGYLHEQIRHYVAENCGKLRVEFVQNSNFINTGSIVSLQMALRSFEATGNVLIVEGDVVADEVLIEEMARAPADAEHITTLLAPYSLDLSGTFAVIENEQVTAWLHEARRTSDFRLEGSFKTVNITNVKAGMPLAKLKETIAAVIKRDGQMAPLEYAMQQLIEDKIVIRPKMTGSYRWYEVDNQQDLAIATKLFACGIRARKTAFAAVPACRTGSTGV